MKSLSVFSSAPARDLRAASSTLRRWCSPDSRSAAYSFDLGGNATRSVWAPLSSHRFLHAGSYPRGTPPRGDNAENPRAPAGGWQASEQAALQ